MSLDAISLRMITPLIKGRSVLCLGYPEHPSGNDTVRWLKDCGADAVDVIDVIRHRGCERIVDLNVDVLTETCGLLINPGTLEHCFNIGQAWWNTWDALTLGGYAMHVMPATMLNHGFYNLSPIAVEDWCHANGGEVVEMEFATNGTREHVKPMPLPKGSSGRGHLPPETVMYALCRKIADVPLQWPTQGCYRR